MLKVIIKGIGERGFEIPNKKKDSFIKSPPIIRKAMLNPMENKRVSVKLSSYNFNNLTRMKPGMKVK